MKKIFSTILIILISSSMLFSAKYEPAIGKSGANIDHGDIRFIFGTDYAEKENNIADFKFGIDFGVGETTEWQNRIDYRSINSSDYSWRGWTEILKFRLSERTDGPAYSLGLGTRIPLSSEECFGVLAGIYISSAIKDIDFDFNIGINPFITYRKKTIHGTDKTKKIRDNHYVNIDLLLGYKALYFLKLIGGFESKQFLKGSKKIDDVKTTTPSGESWIFVFGSRLKPKDYPVVFDGNISFGTGSNKEFDWRFRLGLQILPSSPNAEW